jgi:hydrogenase maturation factor HypF (carbamoyltransferase family)
MSRRHENHTLRRIVLPSGRSIEVVRFDEHDTSVRRLHICPDCQSHLVQPHNWREGPDARWQLTLNCPNCGWGETGLFDRTEVEMLEEQLDQGVADMIDDLQRLTRANMVADIERFISALSADVILPEDF